VNPELDIVINSDGLLTIGLPSGPPHWKATDEGRFGVSPNMAEQVRV
jgi:hypothetical protein